jgi:hypothetical protein
MARCGLVRPEKGEGRRLKPVVTFERVRLLLRLLVGGYCGRW